MNQLIRKTGLEVPRDFAFQWHQREDAFRRLLPPWEKVIVEKPGSIVDGEVHLRTYVGPFAIRWKAFHKDFIQNQQFVDESQNLPFPQWTHFHRFADGESTNSSELVDEIHYKLRGGFPGQLLTGRWVRKKLDRMFDYRHAITRSDLMDHFQFRDSSKKTVAITGASGLVGDALSVFLKMGGHEVIKLPRTTDLSDDAPGWNPQSGKVSFGSEHDSVDSLVHLAGYGIANKRWNPKVKKLILESRSIATEKLSRYISKNNLVKESLLCASALGFYGDRGDEELDENSTCGEGFLPEVASAWEQACQPAHDAGLRVVNFRFGIVLSQKEGALAKLLLPFQLGLGGPIGNGKQFWGWVSLLDAIRSIHYSLMNPKVRGPINVSAGSSRVTQFARTLGKVLWRPAILPFPGFAAKWILGEMAGPLLLASTRVGSSKLCEHGFRFNHPNLESALRFELGKMVESEPDQHSENSN